jgi:hypothetical protein
MEAAMDEKRDRNANDNWNGDERRQGPSAGYKGDDRRRSAAANDGTDAVGVKPPLGDSDEIEGG